MKTKDYHNKETEFSVGDTIEYVANDERYEATVVGLEPKVVKKIQLSLEVEFSDGGTDFVEASECYKPND